MRIWKKIFRIVIILLLADGAMTIQLMTIPPVYAAETRVITVPSDGWDHSFTTQSISERGTLSVSISPLIINNNNPITVMAQDQIIPFSFITHVTDARNSGVGWKITASATIVDFGHGYPLSDMFLDPASPATATCIIYPNCSSASALVLASGNQDLVPGPVTLADAPIATGLGSFNITAYGSFVIPANVPIGPVSGGDISVVIDAAP